MDLLASLDQKGYDETMWYSKRDELQRIFTCKCLSTHSEVLGLSIQHLSQMQAEFEDYFQLLIKAAKKRYKNAQKIKARAINECKRQLVAYEEQKNKKLRKSTFTD